MLEKLFHKINYYALIKLLQSEFVRAKKSN